MAGTASALGDHRHTDVNSYRIVVMGVSGCGKSTVGRGLAEALQIHFVEGDELHSPRSVELMAADTPLTDADRHGWLSRPGWRWPARASSTGRATTTPRRPMWNRLFANTSSAASLPTASPAPAVMTVGMTS